MGNPTCKSCGHSLSGAVLRYGFGVGYDALPEGPLRFTPVVEFVGWTVTSGIVTGSSDGTLTDLDIQDAGGDTIVNVKIGARFGVCDNDAIFIGYGRALTDKVWYDNILRVEYHFVM